MTQLQPTQISCFWKTRTFLNGNIHTNDKDIAQLFYPINFGQQLVDDSVMNSGATSHAPSLLADGINFIKDDDVQTTVSTKLLREEIMLKVTI